ncbi:uncharacterized protein LOC143856338 [Tasmannia lanceolata]|uniref:uncharacterized protein LOC143856338 n=1 Tax=Tasmannia lanceolata TaxID=3420 RepID=UPI0040647801
MEDDALKIEEIMTLLHSSNSRHDKSLAYVTLLQIQEQSANDPSAIQTLAQQSPPLISLICSDASIDEDDEEIASQALKCLGFMVYHPSIVAAIPEGVACLVVESLVKLITTTKMKAICNLGVWCISIQQFDASFIASHLHSLLRAVIHALDNPVGSLSTTFEAIQAVVKLATQVHVKMRDMANIWAPPIYRRLLSCDKRERDMSERCLLKIKSCILPPPLTLSKGLPADIKQKLLPGMKGMLQDNGKKVHSIQAWGWYIRLLGHSAMKNRHLVNEMLKILEQTFSDLDPQVQIASLVAWKALVDALIQPPVLDGPVPSSVSVGNSEIEVDGLLKRIKLIMTPLIGIMSSKYDISVRSSCLNTWCYLLHRLDLSVNHPLVVKTVLEPVLEVIFCSGPDNKSSWIWNSCVDVFDGFILSKVRDGDTDLNDHVNSCNLPTKTASLGPTIGNKDSWKDYPIKWLAWDFNNLSFHLKMIRILINQGLLTTVNPENRKLAFNAALRIFRSVLKGVQVQLKMPSNHFNEIMLWINTILKFVKCVCEDVTSNSITVSISDFLCTSVKFLDAIREELEPSILESPLYKVPLDISYINDLQSANDIVYSKLLGISSVAYMDTVSPMVYLTTLYLRMVAQSLSNLSETEMVPHVMQNYSKFLFSSCDPLESLHAVICLLYMHVAKFTHGEFWWLNIWRVIAKGLKEQIDAASDLTYLRTESDNTGYEMVYWFLCYPFFICYSSPKLMTSLKTSCSELCLISSDRELELELVVEVWKSLFDSANSSSQLHYSPMNSFTEGLCKILTTVSSERISIPQGSTELCLKRKNQNFFFLFMTGEVAGYLLKQIQVLDNVSLRPRVKRNQEDTIYEECSNIKNSMEFVAGFLRLSLTITETKLGAELVLISRVFAAVAAFVGCLFLKQDIMSLMETISNPLVQWLSSCAPIYKEMKEGNAICQLQIFLTQTLDCLRRSHPPIIFDSLFLSVQAPLLQTALDHPYSPISDAAISFWKSTYGKQNNLHYPECLLPVLHKLSRKGKINLQEGSFRLLLNNNWAPHRYRVTATQQRTSKRVEFTEDTENDLGCVDIVPLGLKTKRLKSADHQRKVQIAHQERELDCDGHGPRVKASADMSFTRGCLDSQANYELRKPESILEMLRRAG